MHWGIYFASEGDILLLSQVMSVWHSSALHKRKSHSLNAVDETGSGYEPAGNRRLLRKERIALD